MDELDELRVRIAEFQDWTWRVWEKSGKRVRRVLENQESKVSANYRKRTYEYTNRPKRERIARSVYGREAIPPGGGNAFGSALLFFQDAEHRKAVVENAKAKMDAAIQLVKSAPDNPYGDDDEAIAGELLRRIEEKNARSKT